MKKSLKDFENLAGGGVGAGTKLNVAPALWGTAAAGKAFEVRAKAGKSAAERTADATEETANNTKPRKPMAPAVAVPSPMSRDGGFQNVPIGLGGSAPMAMPIMPLGSDAGMFRDAFNYVFGR